MMAHSTADKTYSDREVLCSGESVLTSSRCRRISVEKVFSQPNANIGLAISEIVDA